MDPAFGHPLWISSGFLMVIVGALLFGWARRSTSAHRAAAGTRDATVGKLFRGGQKPAQKSASKTVAASRFRQSMAQLFGVIGFLLIIAGLMAIFLGIFYVGDT